MVGGEPVGYLQAWSRILTWDDQEAIQLAVRAGLELRASGLRVQPPSCSAMLPPQGASGLGVNVLVSVYYKVLITLM